MTHPTHFFKFMSRGTGRLVLKNGTLRWSTPGTLNDPYDMQFNLHFDVDRQSVISATLEKLWLSHYGDDPVPAGNQFGRLVNAFRGRFPQLSRETFDHEFGASASEALDAMERTLPEFNEAIQSEMATSKILCLSEVSDDMLLWAHYAEEHRGVAARFRSVEGLDSPYSEARAVQYVNGMPKLLDDEFWSDMLSGRKSMDPHAIIKHLVYTKSSHWAYEREWRIYSGDGRNRHAVHEDIPFHLLELDAVILGCRMPEVDRAEFTALCHNLYPHAEVLVATKAEHEFRLVVQPA